MSGSGTIPPTTTGGRAPGVAQRGDDARRDGEVRAVVHRDADDVDVLVARDGGDGLGRLPQARVDHLHARVTQRAGDDLDAAVVTVEPDLGDEDSTGRSRDRALRPRCRTPSRARR